MQLDRSICILQDSCKPSEIDRTEWLETELSVLPYCAIAGDLPRPVITCMWSHLLGFWIHVHVDMKPLCKSLQLQLAEILPRHCTFGASFVRLFVCLFVCLAFRL